MHNKNSGIDHFSKYGQIKIFFKLSIKIFNLKNIFIFISYYTFNA